MKNIFCHIIFLPLLALVLNGCTHNNGDIGPLFGSWRMTAMTVDGQPVEGYEGNVFWMFQNSVVCMREVLPHHETDERWGEWRWADKNTLLLNFSHSDELHQPDDPVYLPLTVTGLAAGDNLLRVERLNGSHMVLTTDSRTYSFRKQ